MPAPAHRVVLHVDGLFIRLVSRRALSTLARKVLAAEAGPLELSIAVTDDETVRELNRRYRHEDAATDVLSFSLEGPAGFPKAAGPRPLGEVVISYPTATLQAAAAGHGVEEELAHLLVHGILHLLGYEHESPREVRAMRTRGEALLGRPAH
jgi:probable rRNA maturation factor